MARGTKKGSGVDKWWFHALFLFCAYGLGAALVAAVVFGLPGIPSFLRPKPKVVERVVEKEVRVMVTPTPPPRFIPRKETNVASLFNGIQYRSRFETSEGALATTEREDDSSYSVDISVRVRVPKPNASLKELTALNSHLADLLPDLPTLLQTARVSPFYHELYDRKVRDLKADLDQLNRLPTRHNFFDCETILELQNPATKRRALLVQAEMDVVADGSDPDRTTKVVGSYTYYQPTTSYGWPRRTKTPNPFVSVYEEKIARWRKELNGGPDAARARELRGAIEETERKIRDLKVRSFLVARADPFVVMPVFMVTAGGAFSPRAGDYAVAIYQDTIYPAIVGDAGPNTKIGEASLRIAQTINPKATAYHRPVSDLTITYIVFPGTAKKPFGPPDYAEWRSECARLLGEIGGHTGVLHEWSDILAAENATPEPSPSPAQDASPPTTAPAADAISES